MDCNKTDCAYYGGNYGCRLLDPDYPGYGTPCTVTACQGDAATVDDYRECAK